MEMNYIKAEIAIEKRGNCLKLPAMLLVLEIALGVILGLWLWKLPTKLRRRKMKNIYLTMPSSSVILEATKTEIYTNDQINLLIELSLEQDNAKREGLATELAESFTT